MVDKSSALGCKQIHKSCFTDCFIWVFYTCTTTLHYFHLKYTDYTVAPVKGGQYLK